MLLLIQIALTVLAFKKGRRWYALIPMITCVSLGFAIGFFGTVSGLGEGLLLGGAFCLDALAIGLLVAIGARGRERVAQQEPSGSLLSGFHVAPSSLQMP